jgi:hypothetical protein
MGIIEILSECRIENKTENRIKSVLWDLVPANAVKQEVQILNSS